MSTLAVASIGLLDIRSADETNLKSIRRDAVTLAEMQSNTALQKAWVLVRPAIGSSGVGVSSDGHPIDSSRVPPESTGGWPPPLPKRDRNRRRPQIARYTAGPCRIDSSMPATDPPPSDDRPAVEREYLHVRFALSAPARPTHAGFRHGHTHGPNTR